MRLRFFYILAFVLALLMFLSCEKKKDSQANLKEAQTLNQKVKALYKKGRYAEAIPLAQRSLKMTKEAVGTEHLNTASCLNNLGGLYYSMGRYEEAIPLLKQALEIHRKILGEHPMTVQSIKSLAVLYIAMGRTEDAVPLFKRAVDIYQKTFGTEHPNTAASLNNLAGLYWRLGRLEDAQELLKQAVAIYQKHSKKTPLDLATTLNTLAAVYRTMGRPQDALPLLEQALEINQKVLGAHPFTVRSFNNLAASYIALGRTEDAVPLLKQALSINRKVLGEKHPTTALTLNNLAVLHVIKGEIDQAFAKALAAENSKKAFVHSILPGLPEKQILAYLGKSELVNSLLLSLCQKYGAEDEEIRTKAFQSVLRGKGYDLAVLSLGQRYKSQKLLKKTEAFQEKQRELAQFVMAGPGKMSIDTFRGRMAQLEREFASIEETLISQSKGKLVDFSTHDTTVKAVAKIIPPEHVLVEFVRYKSHDFQKQRASRVPRYLAFILHRGKNAPEVVDLGAAAPIENAIKDWLKTLKSFGRKVSEANLTSKDYAEAEKRIRQRGEQLKTRLFNPLIERLKSSKNIIISPDGEINLLSFAALPAANGKYLGEIYRFLYVSSGRDLLLWKERKKESYTAPVIVVNPNFALKLADSQPKLSDENHQRLSLKRQEMKFSKLPQTAQEGEVLAQLLKEQGMEPLIYSKGQARESVVKSFNAPFILHIATRRFLLPDFQVKREEHKQGQTVNLEIENKPAGLSQDFPLLKLGLAFAGANGRLSSREDGLATALELTGLNLYGTDLVVLSTHDYTSFRKDSNLDIMLEKGSLGQGVYALTRAFFLAGTKTLIMNLWDMPDEERQQLMSDFYRGWLGGKSKNQALSDAEMNILKKHRKINAAHPFFWGAFICVGQP